MYQKMSRYFLKLLFSVLLFISVVPSASALVVIDFATEINTAITYAKEAQAIENQLLQLKYEAKNIQGFNQQKWDNARSALQELSSVVNKSHSLAYSMSDVDQQFKQKYPGYAKQASTNYSSDYATWVKTNQTTMNGILDQVHQSYQQQKQEEALDQILADRAKTPAGRMQAIQVGNEIAAEQIAQLQKLKATMMAQANAQAVYYAYQSQKDIAQQQSVDAVVKNASSDFPQYRENKQFGQIPKFGN